MTFIGGVLVGLVVGLGGGALLVRPRRTPGADPDPDAGAPRRRRADWGAAAIVLAALALAASGVALARSDRRPRASSGPVQSATTSTTTTAPAAASSTTVPPTAGDTTVSVPNVVGFARARAEAAIATAGLKTTVESLSLANVPAGYVISQNPLPAAQIAAGSTVSLVVSAPN